MAEHIEREELIKKLRTMPIPKQAGSANTWLDNCAAGVNATIREVASFPAANVVPVVHGTWGTGRFNLETGDYEEQCTRCRNFSKEYGKPYCPNCGAKMDGGAEKHGKHI